MLGSYKIKFFVGQPYWWNRGNKQKNYLLIKKRQLNSILNFLPALPLVITKCNKPKTERATTS